jgi:hypothetical protein
VQQGGAPGTLLFLKVGKKNKQQTRAAQEKGKVVGSRVLSVPVFPPPAGATAYQLALTVCEIQLPASVEEHEVGEGRQAMV